MGLFGGGKAMDVRFAQEKAAESQDLYRRLFQDLSKQNQPYTQIGAGGTDKLRDLLGIAPAQGKDWYSQFIPTGANMNKDGTYVANKGWDQYEVRDDGLYKAGNLRRSYEDPNSRFGEYTRVDTADPTAPTDNYGSLLKNFTLDDYEQSPNYQFNLAEGEKAINRAAAARGDYLSPEAVKELSGYSQNLASNEYLNSYNMDAQNKGRTYDMLMGTTGVGQNAMAQQSGNSFAYGGATADLNGQIAQLDLASQADKAAKRQSSFGNKLMNLSGTMISGNTPWGNIYSGSFGGGGSGTPLPGRKPL